MNTSTTVRSEQGTNPVRFVIGRTTSGNLHLVTEHDLDKLRTEVKQGDIPADLAAKLDKLAKGNLGDRFIEQNCRTMFALLVAARMHSFKELSELECERLLSTLAYVRRDDDAIPDYQPKGFLDDQQEVRSL